MSTTPAPAPPAVKPVSAKFDPITAAALAKLHKKHDVDNWPIKSSNGYEFGPTTLTPNEFLKEGEQSVTGYVMRERGKELGRAFSLDNLLVMVEEENANPGTVIPVEYRGQHYFPADGTILLGGGGGEYFAYAVWGGGRQRWVVGVDGLEGGWFSFARLLRPPSK